MIYKHALHVVNEALALLGQTKMMDHVDTESQDPIWRALASLYDSTRKDVLLAHPWNFALREVNAGDTTRVQLPGDCLMIRSMKDIDGVEIEHTRIGHEVKCTTPCHTMRYTRDDDEPDSWDHWVRQVLVYRLACEFSLPVKGSLQRDQRMEQKLKVAMDKAVEINSAEVYGRIQDTYARDIIDGKRV
jgi:hypothetical protein